ncbi:MAG: prepilin-type N-terminal cleavage/methylation domain-containing protein [bacterium]|nr:prepilin-type N-terminal cleavage/methylation domain-containing protein [bacterium]
MRPRPGMSLMEVVTVMVIVAVLAAVAIPRYANALVNRRLDSAVLRIAADLKLAERRARTTSSSQSVVFDVAAHTYTLTGVTDLDRSAEEYAVDLAEPPYEVEILYAKFESGTQITFDGYGQASGDGKIVLKVGNDFKLVVFTAATRTVETSSVEDVEIPVGGGEPILIGLPVESF